MIFSYLLVENTFFSTLNAKVTSILQPEITNDSYYETPRQYFSCFRCQDITLGTSHKLANLC